MFSFQKHSLLLARRLDMVAAVAIFAMMALTCVDVFLRYFFRKPIPGTYEIIALLGAVAVLSFFESLSANYNHRKRS